MWKTGFADFPGVDGILGRDLFAVFAVRLARGRLAIAPLRSGPRFEP